MEGPSLHLLADELHNFVNLIIKKAYGNAAFDKEILLNQRIHAIYAFGKRLIIQLDTHALVTHFLMYGTYRIDNERPHMAPRLALITARHALYFYNCSVKCLEKRDVIRLIPLEWDILSPNWDVKKVVAAIKKHPQKTIDDILLDQEIFPGVGNIIKNEVLFLSKVSSFKKINELTNKKINEVAMHARTFSQKFLELRKKFELKKNLDVYRKKVCPVCQAKIVRAKTGQRNRWSFMCPICQKIKLSEI